MVAAAREALRPCFMQLGGRPASAWSGGRAELREDECRGGNVMQIWGENQGREPGLEPGLCVCRACVCNDGVSPRPGP